MHTLTMKANVGTYDAAARFVAASVLLILANHGYRWGLAGFALAISCAGFCPIYWLLRLDTTDRRRGSQDSQAALRDKPMRSRAGRSAAFENASKN